MADAAVETMPAEAETAAATTEPPRFEIKSKFSSLGLVSLLQASWTDPQKYQSTNFVSFLSRICFFPEFRRVECGHHVVLGHLRGYVRDLS